MTDLGRRTWDVQEIEELFPCDCPNNGCDPDVTSSDHWRDCARGIFYWLNLQMKKGRGARRDYDGRSLPRKSKTEER